jgi:hypothetical protein
MNTNSWLPLAVLEFLVPRRLVAASERLAFRNPEAARLRRGVISVARMEGLVFIWVALRGGPVPSWLRAFVGTLGVPMLLLPKRAVDVAMRLGYRNADEVDVRRWVQTATRVLGLAYVLVAIGVFPRDRDE